MPWRLQNKHFICGYEKEYLMWRLSSFAGWVSRGRGDDAPAAEDRTPKKVARRGSTPPFQKVARRGSQVASETERERWRAEAAIDSDDHEVELVREETSELPRF